MSTIDDTNSQMEPGTISTDSNSEIDFAEAGDLNDDKEIKDALVSCGLDADYWLQILKGKFHITSKNQLDNLDWTNLDCLRKHVRQNRAWEENGIKKLLKRSIDKSKLEQKKDLEIEKEIMTDRYEVETMYEKRTEMINKRVQDERNSLLQSITPISQQTEYQKRFPEFRKSFESNDDQLFNGQNSSDLKSKTADLLPLEVSSQYTVQQTDVQKISLASAGRILRGVYLQADGSLETKSTVIDIGPQVKTKGPSDHQKETIRNFSSKKQKENFEKHFEITNTSTDGGLTLEFLLAETRSTFSWEWGHELKETKSSGEEELFESTVKYCTVPIASVELQIEDFVFHPIALKALQSISQKLQQRCEVNEILAKCKRFFEKFGSHVNEGFVHFGGIHQYSAIFTSTKKADRKKTSSITNDALKGGIQFAASGIGNSIGGAISGNTLREKGFMGSKTDYTVEDLSDVTFELETIGGPPTVNWNVEEWKKGLNDPKVWAVISGGNLTGVWNVLGNHSTDFVNQENLKQVMECSWILQNIKGQSVYNTSTYSETLKIMHLTMLKLHDIWKDPSLIQNLIECNENLQLFINAIPEKHEELLSLDRAEDFWGAVRRANFTKSRELSMFMSERMKLKEKLPSTISTKNFGSSLEFVNNLKTSFLPHIRLQYESKKEDMDTYTTVEMTTVCRRHLVMFKRDNAWEYFKLTALLSVLMYDEDDGFPRQLVLRDLEELVEKSSTWLRQFDDLNTFSGIKRDANVLILVIRVIETKKLQIFKRCYEAVSIDLDVEVRDIVDKYLECYSLEELCTDLERKVLSNALISMPVQRIKNVSKNITVRVDGAELNIPTQLISFLANTEFFKFLPEKLELCHVISIKPYIEDQKDALLRKFIECIIVQNSSIFESVKTFVRADEDARLDAETGDDFDFLNVDSTDDIRTCDINPLDLIMAVFVCSSQSLKEYLVYKMHQCRLAVPILMPIHASGDVKFDMSILRSIAVEAKDKTYNSVLNCYCSLVSFIRIGRPQFSKSKLINEFVQKQSHDIFVNYETPLGSTKRMFSDGTVEIAFFTESSSGDTCGALNLRGNANEFPTQTQLLAMLSNVIVVCISLSNLLDENTITIFQLISRCTADLVIALDARSCSKTDVRKTTYELNSMLTPIKPKYVLLSMEGVRQRSVAEIARDIQKQVISSLKNVPSETLGLYTTRLQIAVQMSVEEVKAVETSDILLQKPRICRKELVPLQMEVLYELNNYETSLYNPVLYKKAGGRDSVREKLRNTLLTQLKYVENIHDFIIEFIGNLINLADGANMVTYVNGVKYHLLELNDKLTNTMKTDAAGVFESNFAFEHIVREMGQIYKAVSVQPSMVDVQTLELTKLFPAFIAKLIKYGFPFEILNGEIVHVAVDWIKAVIDELICIIGDRKCLIMSVVGTQSSGKSTLLNTMFGLRFPVGHGRVTKGAHLQLIQVEEKSLPYDCILMIDTEGLRAPEFSASDYKRDNRFATFIMGLADITIINIKGEFSSEMNEILQMVVHSLLRLRLSNKDVKTYQSCVFIHQSVRGDRTDDGLQQTMRSITERLNDMTRESAEMLNLNVNEFKDVVNFDPTKHAFYLPNLLSGEEPMMYTSQNYSAKAVDIRQKLLSQVLESQDNQFMVLSNVSILIQDIWTGVLADDFALQFKNGLEVKAYTLIDNKFQELVNGMDHALNMLMREKKFSIIKCSDESLNLTFSEIQERLPAEIQSHSEKIHKELNDFIDCSNLKKIMEKYRQNFSIRVDHEVNKTREISDSRLKRIRHEVAEERKREHILREFLEKIDDESSKLAKELKGKDIEIDSLNTIFTGKWETWAAENLPKEYQYEKPIPEQIMQYVQNKYKSHLTFLNWLNSNDYMENSECLPALQTSISINEIKWNVTSSDTQPHVSIPKTLFGYGPKYPPYECKTQTLTLTNNLFIQIETYFMNKDREETNFEVEDDMGHILHLIDSCFKEQNDKKNKRNHDFKLTMVYKDLILSKVLPYCIVRCTKIRKRYERAHSIKGILRAYKPIAQALFIDSINCKAEDEIASDLFMKAVTKCIKDDVDAVLPTKVEQKIMTEFKHSKYTMLKEAMTHLATLDNFDAFIWYLNAPESFVERWLIDFTDNCLFRRTSNQSLRLYDELCKLEIEKAIAGIKNAVTATTKELMGKPGNPVEKWIKRFVTKASQSSITEEKLSLVRVRKITEISRFQQTILLALDELKDSMIRDANEITVETIKWKTNPYNNIFTCLWGCNECCPFCNEPCELSADHLRTQRHRCRFHRPQGVGDFAWSTGSGELVSEFCSNLITTAEKFQAQDSGKQYEYRHYKQKFPHWDIPETFEHPKYWIWVFVQYNEQMAKQNHVKAAKIPSSWPKVNKQEAIDSL